MTVPSAEASITHTPPAMADPEKADLEKGVLAATSPSLSSQSVNPPPPIKIPSTLRKWNDKIEGLAGLEARGITRVMPDERHEATLMGYVQMSFLWFSANLTANNIAVAFLGPLVFELGFLDSAFCALGGAFLGSAGTAYMSIWGAQSGSRTMVSDIVDARFFGKWKLITRRLWRGTLWDTGRANFALFSILSSW
jgi:hypothetical protein